jgi:hypothetical protein
VKAFQVSECNFKEAHADTTPGQCSTTQRRQLNFFKSAKAYQISESSFQGGTCRLNANSMQHKQAKAAQFQVSESNSSQGKHFKSTNEVPRRHMQLQGGACRFNANSMKHKSAKAAYCQRNATQVSEGSSTPAKCGTSQQKHFKSANAAHAD